MKRQRQDKTLELSALHSPLQSPLQASARRIAVPVLVRDGKPCPPPPPSHAGAYHTGGYSSAYNVNPFSSLPGSASMAYGSVSPLSGSVGVTYSSAAQATLPAYATGTMACAGPPSVSESWGHAGTTLPPVSTMHPSLQQQPGYAPHHHHYHHQSQTIRAW